MQIAVSGYYGCGNAGDEAVLAGIHEAFRQRAPKSIQLVVLSQDPVKTEQQHGLRAADRMNLSVLRRVLQQSDLLLSGGGSLLQDTTSIRSLLYYLWVARMAYNLGTPVMFYAQGMGPLRRPLSRTLVRIVANRAASITVRDEPSARLLASLGVNVPPVEVTADPAFALTPAAADAVDALCLAEGLPQGVPLIGVSLRPWGGSAPLSIDAYARLLTELNRQCNGRVVLLPMQVPVDVTLAEEVARQAGGAFFIVRGSYAPETLLGLIGRMQVVVAMRLHALIFAARTAVPPFALSYDPKVENLMNGLGLADSLEAWRGFDPGEVAGRVAAILAQRADRVAALAAQNALLEQRALHNADCALALLPARASYAPSLYLSD